MQIYFKQRKSKFCFNHILFDANLIPIQILYVSSLLNIIISTEPSKQQKYNIISNKNM